MAWTYNGPKDVPTGSLPDPEFGADPEQPEPTVFTVADERRGGFKDAKALVAKSMAELVKAGAPLAEAAAALGTTVEGLRTNSKARAALARMRRDWELDTDEMRQLVKTTAVEMAITAVGKERLDAAKLIAQMPDVGLTSAYVKTNVTVGVFSDETKSVLAGIEIEAQ